MKVVPVARAQGAAAAAAAADGKAAHGRRSGGARDGTNAAAVFASVTVAIDGGLETAALFLVALPVVFSSGTTTPHFSVSLRVVVFLSHVLLLLLLL